MAPFLHHVSVSLPGRYGGVIVIFLSLLSTRAAAAFHADAGRAEPDDICTRALLAIRDIKIRALNYDNCKELGALVETLSPGLRRQPPRQGVYFERFWTRQENPGWPAPRFINLAAWQGADLIAHLGLNASSSPARLRSFRLRWIFHRARISFAVARAAWGVLSELARRQKWPAIYFFCPLTHPAIQVLSVKCFHSRSLPYCPDTFRSRGDSASTSTSQRAVLLMYTALHERPDGRIKLFLRRSTPG